MINKTDKLAVFRQPNTQAATAEAGERLNNLLLENKDRPTLLMLSGGSALGILDYVGRAALGDRLTVSMLDERFSTDPKINNFEQMQKTDFYKDALNAECDFFGTLPRPEDTPLSLAKRWGTNLKLWKSGNPEGLILATLGMGADGHTAGIFPHPNDAPEFHRLFENNNWTAAYDASGKHQYNQRITTTLTFLNLVDVGLALVCGADKKPKLKELLDHQGEPNQLPALGWYQIKDVKVFTDLE